MSIKAEISVGEFLDKLTILQIKTERISEQGKLENIARELHVLQEIWRQTSYAEADVIEEMAELKSINEQLWDIEDNIRGKELKKEMDEEFIQLARSVYITNDKRAVLKKKINLKLGSEFVEEKSYSKY